MTLGNARGVTHAVVVTLEDTLAVVNAFTVGNARGDAHALADTG